jgi:hypothetical protein
MKLIAQMLFLVSARSRGSRAAAFRPFALALTLSPPVFRAPLPVPDFDPPFFPLVPFFLFFAIT